MRARERRAAGAALPRRELALAARQQSLPQGRFPIPRGCVRHTPSRTAACAHASPPLPAAAAQVGKPVFHNYGRGNIKTPDAGILYGNYMKSHNVQPDLVASPGGSQSYPLPYRGGAGSKVTKSIKVGRDRAHTKARLQTHFEKQVEIETNKEPEVSPENKDPYRGKYTAGLSQAEERRRKAAGAPPPSMFSVLRQDDEAAASAADSAAAAKSGSAHAAAAAGAKAVAKAEQSAARRKPCNRLRKEQPVGGRHGGAETANKRATLQRPAPAPPPAHSWPWQPEQRPDWDPRNYKHLPVTWTRQIQPAGINSVRSETVQDVLFLYE